MTRIERIQTVLSGNLDPAMLCSVSPEQVRAAAREQNRRGRNHPVFVKNTG